jgi:hypothetical protein
MPTAVLQFELDSPQQIVFQQALSSSTTAAIKLVFCIGFKWIGFKWIGRFGLPLPDLVVTAAERTTYY